MNYREKAYLLPVTNKGFVFCKSHAFLSTLKVARHSSLMRKKNNFTLCVKQLFKRNILPCLVSKQLETMVFSLSQTACNLHKLWSTLQCCETSGSEEKNFDGKVISADCQVWMWVLGSATEIFQCLTLCCPLSKGYWLLWGCSSRCYLLYKIPLKLQDFCSPCKFSWCKHMKLIVNNLSMSV